MRVPFAAQVAMAAGIGFGSVWFVTNPPEPGAIASVAMTGPGSLQRFNKARTLRTVRETGVRSRPTSICTLVEA